MLRGCLGELARGREGSRKPHEQQRIYQLYASSNLPARLLFLLHYFRRKYTGLPRRCVAEEVAAGNEFENKFL
jgi:hypothetical protein